MWLTKMTQQSQNVIQICIYYVVEVHPSYSLQHQFVNAMSKIYIISNIFLFELLFVIDDTSIHKIYVFKFVLSLTITFFFFSFLPS